MNLRFGQLISQAIYFQTNPSAEKSNVMSLATINSQPYLAVQSSEKPNGNVLHEFTTRFIPLGNFPFLFNMTPQSLNEPLRKPTTVRITRTSDRKNIVSCTTYSDDNQQTTRKYVVNSRDRAKLEANTNIYEQDKDFVLDAASLREMHLDQGNTHKFELVG